MQFNPINEFRRMPKDKHRVSVAKDYNEEDEDVDGALNDALEDIDVS